MVYQDHLSAGGLVVRPVCHAVFAVERGFVPGVVGPFRRGSRSAAGLRDSRHQVQTILAIAAVAVVCGAGSFAAIGEWAADAPPWVLAALGARRGAVRSVLIAPHEATLRTIQVFDADLLDTVIGQWLAHQGPAPAPEAGLAAIAVDGKTVRGARRGDGTQLHLLAAISHENALVLAQREVAAKTNEIPELAPLLAGLDLSNVVITADALHTQQDTARHLLADRNADYVLR